MDVSANIPFEIQEEIIKRSPVKSLLRFRSVSKQWKSLIQSSEFITHHSLNQTQPHHLLIKYRTGSELKYVSIIDDDSFPHHKFTPAVPHAASSMIGCSHGLVCLFHHKGSVIFWNPSIRKSVRIALPFEAYAFGFGVCPKTLDPKIVRVSKIDKISHIIEAKVYTLSYGAWRNISVNRPSPHKSMWYLDKGVVIDGVIYWTAFDDKFNCCGIITFDLTSEKFGEVDIPDSLAGCKYLDISKLNESLVVLDWNYDREPICDVWMMLKNGVPKSSFTKLFSVNVGYNNYTIIGFRKNGQLIYVGDGELKVYEPGSEHMNGLGIYGSLFQMASYTESLLLLNHPDSIIH